MIKIQINDRIKIINYGNLVTIDDGIEHGMEDAAPHLIGKEGIIIKIEAVGGYGTLIEGKIRWLKRDQIELLPSLQEEQFLAHLDELTKDATDRKLEFILELKLKFIDIWKRDN